MGRWCGDISAGYCLTGWHLNLWQTIWKKLAHSAPRPSFIRHKVWPASQWSQGADTTTFAGAKHCARSKSDLPTVASVCHIMWNLELRSVMLQLIVLKYPSPKPTGIPKIASPMEGWLRAVPRNGAMGTLNGAEQPATPPSSNCFAASFCPVSNVEKKKQFEKKERSCCIAFPSPCFRWNDTISVSAFQFLESTASAVALPLSVHSLRQGTTTATWINFNPALNSIGYGSPKPRVSLAPEVALNQQTLLSSLVTSLDVMEKKPCEHRECRIQIPHSSSHALIQGTRLVFQECRLLRSFELSNNQNELSTAGQPSVFEICLRVFQRQLQKALKLIHPFPKDQSLTQYPPQHPHLEHHK